MIVPRFHIRKNDLIMVTTGKEKGKSGRVLSVDLAKGICTVEHVNMLKRHTRPNPAKQIKGGIVEREGVISVSNVMVICPKCDKPTRVRHAVRGGDGLRVLACRKCDQAWE